MFPGPSPRFVLVGCLKTVLLVSDTTNSVTELLKYRVHETGFDPLCLVNLSVRVHGQRRWTEYSIGVWPEVFVVYLAILRIIVVFSPSPCIVLGVVVVFDFLLFR